MFKEKCELCRIETANKIYTSDGTHVHLCPICADEILDSYEEPIKVYGNGVVDLAAHDLRGAISDMRYK